MKKNQNFKSAPDGEPGGGTYPPTLHWIRDLGIWVDSEGDRFRAGLPIEPGICTSEGGVRAGVIATLVDVVAGAAGAHAVAPDWIATCDLVLHLLRRPAGPELIASSKLIRRGRSTAVLEVEVASGEDDALVALSTVTFSILAARTPNQQVEKRNGPTRTEFALEHSGFDEALTTRLGAREIDPREGHWTLALAPYNANSLDALQGGALATLIELSCESLGRAIGEPDWVTTDYAIHFLSLGRPGPLEARSKLLRRDAQHALQRIEVVDRGADDRLVAVATATCETLA